jgi:uncharacterized protein (UPF0276 family)
MQFALNYSPQAAELLAAGVIDIDRFKIPPWPELLEAALRYRPVSLHFELRAGGAEPIDADWDAIDAHARQTGTPLINLHLSPRRDEYPAIPHDSIAPAHRDQLTEAMIRDVRTVVARFGAERVIVENVPYHGADGQIPRAPTHPDVIRRVVAETGCGLLMDISHGVIAARCSGTDERAYLAALPTHRLRELHVTGIKTMDGRLRDHLDLSEADWENFGWVLAQIESGAWAMPWQVAFEYGGIGPIFDWRSESRVIAEQVPPMVDMVRQASL